MNPRSKIFMALGIGMYLVAFVWLVVDYMRSDFREIWFLIGILFLGIFLFAFPLATGRATSIAVSLRSVGIGSFLLGSGLVAFSALGARGVRLETRELVLGIILAGGVVILGLHWVKWLRRGAQDRG